MNTIIKARIYGDEDSLFQFASIPDLIDSFPAFVYTFVVTNQFILPDDIEELKADIKTAIGYDKDTDGLPYLDPEFKDKYHVNIECTTIMPLEKMSMDFD